MAKISVIIPAYNEEAAIAEVIKRVKNVSFDYELIVVDDGSTDKTAFIAEGLGVRVIRHPYNKGYGEAIKTGVKAASYNVVFLLDADRQHNPEDIPRFLAYLGEFDMVVGERRRGSRVPPIRRIGKWFLRKVAIFLARRDIPDLNSGFRLVKKNILLNFIPILPDTFSLSTTLTLAVIKSGYTIKYIPIKTEERLGRSTLNPLRDGYKTLMLIFSLIVLFDPLRVFCPAGMILLIPGFFYTMYELFFHHNIPDSGILFITVGINLLFFGILSEQINQIRRQIK